MEEQQQSKKEDDSSLQAPFMKIQMQKTEKKYDGMLGSIVRYEQVHFAIQEFFLQAETSIVLNNLNFIMSTVDLFNLSVNKMNAMANKLQFDKCLDKKFKDICPFMDASQGIIIDETQIDVNKLSFGIIMIGSVKAKITLNLEKTSLDELNLVSSHGATSQFLSWISPLLRNFASISNSAITLNELVILEAFISWELLQKNI